MELPWWFLYQSPLCRSGPALSLSQAAASVLLSLAKDTTATLTESRGFSQISLLLIKRRIYMGRSSTLLLRSRNLCASVSTKTIVPATVSHSKSALVCGIIGWGFRWKRTAGEKTFFLEGEMVLVRGRKALFSGPQWEIGTGEESHRD